MKENKMGTHKGSDYRQGDMLKEVEGYKTTKELATLLRVQSTTIIRGLCIHGHYLGLKPRKLPNNRLLWSSFEAQNLFKK